jgi:hypothetical protein
MKQESHGFGFLLIDILAELLDNKAVVPRIAAPKVVGVSFYFVGNF